MKLKFTMVACRGRNAGRRGPLLSVPEAWSGGLHRRRKSSSAAAATALAAAASAGHARHGREARGTTTFKGLPQEQYFPPPFEPQPLQIHPHRQGEPDLAPGEPGQGSQGRAEADLAWQAGKAGKLQEIDFQEPAWSGRPISANPNVWSSKHWGGHGWHHHHYWSRWYGPVFWPYFFGDYFCYGFWPGYCSDVYWGYGPDVIVWGAFWPSGEYYYDEAAAAEATETGDIYHANRARARNTDNGRAQAKSPTRPPSPKPAQASRRASATCPSASSKASSMPRPSSATRLRISKPPSSRPPGS